MLYERALAANPDLFEAHLAAGMALDLKGDYVQARRHLGRALEKPPAGAEAQALTAMGVSCAFERKPRAAAASYQRLFDHQTADGNLPGAAETANALGRVYLESGDTAGALKVVPHRVRDGATAA